jgi:hypothetical protein
MAQSRLNASNRVLSAAFQAVCHFRFLLESWTNHKPLTHALHRVSEPLPATQQRQLLFPGGVYSQRRAHCLPEECHGRCFIWATEPMPDVRTVAEATGVKAPSGVACHRNQHLSSSASSLEPLVEVVPLSWSLQSYWGLIIISRPKTSWLAEKYCRCSPIPLLWFEAFRVGVGEWCPATFPWHCTLSGTFPMQVIFLLGDPLWRPPWCRAARRILSSRIVRPGMTGHMAMV